MVLYIFLLQIGTINPAFIILNIKVSKFHDFSIFGTCRNPYLYILLAYLWLIYGFICLFMYLLAYLWIY